MFFLSCGLPYVSTDQTPLHVGPPSPHARSPPFFPSTCPPASLPRVLPTSLPMLYIYLPSSPPSDSIMAAAASSSAQLQLPPGFRFHPTDDELVTHYLCPKCASRPISVPIIADIDLYRYDPWDLPAKALYGEKEWYFFSPRNRKYPNGSRPNRAAGTGYWKATGADKPIGHPRPAGIKKALVFYAGKAPKGEKTNWIMHEYRLADVDRSARKNTALKLDDWVLCRIYNKKGIIEKQPTVGGRKTEWSEMEEDMKPGNVSEGVGIPGHPPHAPAAAAMTDFLYFDKSDSVPKLHTESSCSEHVVSPEFASEVQSESKWNEWEKKAEFPYNYAAVATMNNGLGSQTTQLVQSNNQMSSLQDIFMYFQKPF